MFACQNANTNENKETNSTTNNLEAVNAIRQVLDFQVASWNKGSIDSFMMGYNPSKQLKFITKRGIQLGYDSVLSRYKRYYSSREKMGQLSFDNLDFERLSNEPEIFQVTGNWQITGADSSGGNFSLLFKKIEKDWKIIVDHTW
jgi:hypothetical protein